MRADHSHMTEDDTLAPPSSAGSKASEISARSNEPEQRARVSQGPSDACENAKEPRRIVRSRRSRWITFRRLILFVVGVLFACLVALGTSFFSFVATLNTAPMDELRSADGIVVFTGGRERITNSLSLLAEGKAKRLLISGVHPETTAEQISRLTERKMALFQCCVDLDRRARDTIGNAAETAAWAHKNEFKSIVVVTSAYHMPRALTELQALLPDVEIIPNPVFHEGLDLRHWYLEGETTKLLLREFVKYTLVRVRVSWNALL